LPNAKAENQLLLHPFGSSSKLTAPTGNYLYKITPNVHPLRLTPPRSFTHAITGDRRQHRDPEAIGGILADEMGLGKTLKMLASIAGSLVESHRFAGQDTGGSGPNVKGTLVIAPSIRTFHMAQPHL